MKETIIYFGGSVAVEYSRLIGNKQGGGRQKYRFFVVVLLLYFGVECVYNFVLLLCVATPPIDKQTNLPDRKFSQSNRFSETPSR